MILIVGGGLSGLALARHLNDAGMDFQLLEARSRWGGRILTHTIEQQGFDLGPSWFWPGQPRIAALIKQLSLNSLDQHYLGERLFQDEAGQVHRDQGMVSMQGSWRLQGGLGLLIERLVSELPANRLHLNTAVCQINQTSNGLKAQTETNTEFLADHIVLALPPRVACNLRFEPALSDAELQSANHVATWMASHAKAVMVYDTAFWKKQGLSGDASSRIGPLMEIHDASPASGGPYALFGFLGVPPEQREANGEHLQQGIINQLASLFGKDAAQPKQLLLQDWARELRTATPLDRQPLFRHPVYGRPPALNNLWQGRLHFGSTEMGAQFGGFLEGAVEVAEELAARLSR